MASLHSSPHSLRSPPVYETALAVQFEDLSRFQTVHFGLLYQRFADNYPVAEDHPRSPPIVETFPKTPAQIGFAIKKAGPERVWFRDQADGNRLIQVQPDRFGFNWRRNAQSDQYDRFESSGSQFLANFEIFKSFCEEANIGTVRPNLVETVYVNRVFPEAGETVVNCMQRSLAGVILDASPKGLQVELASFNRVYQIVDKPGRMYIEAGIGEHREQGNFVLIKLTARVGLSRDDDLAASLQQCHDVLVSSFFEVTTAEARARWNQDHDR